MGVLDYLFRQTPLPPVDELPPDPGLRQRRDDPGWAQATWHSPYGDVGYDAAKQGVDRLMHQYAPDWANRARDAAVGWNRSTGMDLDQWRRLREASIGGEKPASEQIAAKLTEAHRAIPYVGDRMADIQSYAEPVTSTAIDWSPWGGQLSATDKSLRALGEGNFGEAALQGGLAHLAPDVLELGKQAAAFGPKVGHYIYDVGHALTNHPIETALTKIAERSGESIWKYLAKSALAHGAGAVKIAPVVAHHFAHVAPHASAEGYALYDQGRTWTNQLWDYLHSNANKMPQASAAEEEK